MISVYNLSESNKNDCVWYVAVWDLTKYLILVGQSVQLDTMALTFSHVYVNIYIVLLKYKYIF